MGTKAIIAVIGVIVFVLVFLLAPIVTFQCGGGLLSTKGSVSMSCYVFGFGEVHQEAFGVTGNSWSNNCQIHTVSLLHCTIGETTPSIKTVSS